MAHDRQMAATVATFDLDVVGMGAFNLDYLANASASTTRPGVPALATRIAELFADDPTPFEWNTERSVDERKIYEALAEVNAVSLDATMGGSAFNAMFALAQMRLNLRLGFVGVAGRVPIVGMSSVQQLAALGIDHRLVRRDDAHLCGICFALQLDGERTLLTHAGANAFMADHLTERFDDVVGYLASARVVHVTSFLDPRTAAILGEVLAEVKHTSADTLISFDPGHVWSSQRSPEVERIVELTDVLLVNNREFTEFGEAQPGEPDAVVGERLLGRYNKSMTVVVKRSEGVSALRFERGEVKVHVFRQMPLPDEEIEDATGAGDVFAAGLLAAASSNRLGVEMGSLLGMQLARHKLQYVGTRGHDGFAEITRRFIETRDAERRRAHLPGGVFIAHGGDPQWRALKSFVESDCNLPVYTFESGVWGSTQVTEALSQYLEQCGFAVCVLTAEDFSVDGRRSARQNVVHEVGLFQGRYGFDRVMVLVEEGCDFVPPTAAPFSMTFTRNNVESTFWQVAKMLRAQHPAQPRTATT